MGIFGPSQKETWTQFSSELNATFVKGGVWDTHKVVAREKVWTITLDTYAVHTGKATVPFTRFRAPFVSKDNFRFSIERRDFFSPIADFFGRKSLSTGHPDFDKNFVIKSPDEYKLKKFFANENIRELITKQKEVHLEIKDQDGEWPYKRFPSDVDQVYFQMSGVVKDVERLKSAFRLVAESLNQLAEIGTAHERDPNVTLK
jgi:hypothetical protein